MTKMYPMRYLNGNLPILVHLVSSNVVNVVVKLGDCMDLHELVQISGCCKIPISSVMFYLSSFVDV